jgi:glycerol-3-phosphate cytidylyltransferase-like family protein
VSDVDYAMLGYLDDVYRVLVDVAPDVICLGYDQSFFVDKLEGELKKRKLKTKIVRLPAFQEHKFKSSLLRKKLG